MSLKDEYIFTVMKLKIDDLKLKLTKKILSIKSPFKLKF